MMAAVWGMKAALTKISISFIPHTAAIILSFRLTARQFARHYILIR
jgi:hypothetical protein